MKSFVKKILFCAIIFIGIIAVLLFKTPLRTETNLMSLVNINSSNHWPVNQISEKFSSIMNIVIESTDEKTAKKTANTIIRDLNTDSFDCLHVQSNNFSLKSLTGDFVAHNGYLLSDYHKKLLHNDDTKTIADIAIKQISESMVPQLFSVSNDPFLLLSDFLISMQKNGTKWTLRDGILWQYVGSKHYFMIPVNTDSLDSEKTSAQINLFHQKLQKIQSDTIKIHISGVPVHTAFMMQQSKIELGFLSVLALIAAMVLNYLLFKRLVSLVPVIFSLFIGFLCGTIALFLCFDAPHILSFVFGTTLIGLGIDYSFHFMTMGGLKKKNAVSKNILISLITTTVCFLPLLFSSIPLLQQISIFTIIGLISIYFALKLFLPTNLKLKTKDIKCKFVVSKKYKFIFIVILGLVSILTLPFVRIENNMNQMYQPNEKILQEDMFFQKLNQSEQSSILLVRGKSIQEILETEEDIKAANFDFLSVSSIIPSIRNQIENHKLIQKLYDQESKYIKRKLGLRNLPKLADTKPMSINSIESEFINDWLNKLIIRDDDYIYSISQIGSNISALPENASIVSPSDILTQRMKKWTFETYNLLFICAICLVCLLGLIYRKRAIKYLLPSMLGILLTISILTWFNQPITFFHLLSFFIVIGLSLDYTIFHINAHDSKEMRPVLFSFLTSFIGFGLLGFTSFFLIKSMGITLCLGLGTSYLISLYLFGTQKLNSAVRIRK